MERIKFDIPIWDEPHQDKFEKGITHPAIYVGDRFVLVAVRKKDDLVQEPLAEYSKTDKEKGDIKFFVDDDKYTVEIDSWKNPFVCAALTAKYDHEPCPNWSEELGVDDEVWEYTYSDTHAVIPHIFKTDTFYYKNGEFTRPKVHTHPIDEKQFWENMETHKQDMIRELARGSDVYKQVDLDAIEKCRQWLETAPTRYKNVKHYKIKCPDFPAIKP